MKKYGPQFYGLTARRHVQFINDGQQPTGPYQLLTTYSPATLEKGAIHGLHADQIREATQMVRERRGLLARMTNRYVRLARFLGNDHWPFYDCGTFVLSDTSRYFIYAIAGDGEKRTGPLAVVRIQPACRAGAFIR